MSSFISRASAALVAGLVITASGALGHAADRGFAPHRAIYEMRLDAGSSGAEFGAVEGRLVYEFSGSACEGWESRFRLVTRLSGAEGARLTDLRTSSFEDPEGRGFSFLNENWVDQRKVEETKGRAERAAAGVHVRLERPEAKDVDLPATVRFPTEHLAQILKMAMAGETFGEIVLYDGSDSGEKSFRTTVVIGRKRSGDEDTTEEPAARHDLLKGHRRWPVDISFFDPAKKDAGETTPDYQLGFLLYDNGISRNMRLDYGSFALRGTLSSLEALPSSPCP